MRVDLQMFRLLGSSAEEAFEAGFMTGFLLFLPNQPIPKVQAIVAFNQWSGFGLAVMSQILSEHYVDAGLIPSYAVNNVAAATQANVVVNYP